MRPPTKDELAVIDAACARIKQMQSQVAADTAELRLKCEAPSWAQLCLERGVWVDSKGAPVEGLNG